MIGAILAAYRALERGPAVAGSPIPPLPWRLRGLPVCASTELELDRWLARLAAATAVPALPMAVLARRQRFGRGQRGRLWQSPPGGVWISAALPWPADPRRAAAPGLAAAVGLALQLEPLGLAVAIKWPNDLLLLEEGASPGRKLAGLLPRLRLQAGAVRWARLGLGLNGRHRPPQGAAGVPLPLPQLAARVLLALEWAVAWAERPEAVRQLAEARLQLPPGPVWEQGLPWQPLGLATDGGLLLGRGPQRLVLQRRFAD